MITKDELATIKEIVIDTIIKLEAPNQFTDILTKLINEYEKFVMR